MYLHLMLDRIILSISIETGNLTRQRFAYLDRTDNYTFTFEPGFNDDFVYPGKNKNKNKNNKKKIQNKKCVCIIIIVCINVLSLL